MELDIIALKLWWVYGELYRDGKIFFLLQGKFIGFNNQARETNNQKLPPELVLISMPKWVSTTWYCAVVYLLILELFFAMQSCEYLTTRYPEESKSANTLILVNIKFNNYRNIILHRIKLDTLESATIIITKYSFQKNLYRYKSVQMFRTDDELIWSLEKGAKVVKWVRAISGTADNNKICAYNILKGKKNYINLELLLAKLRLTVLVIGK